MKKTVLTGLAAFVFGALAFSAHSAEVCKVSMMGRVCFEEGSAEAIAAHMKKDAVAEANAKKGIKVASKEVDSKGK